MTRESYFHPVHFYPTTSFFVELTYHVDTNEVQYHFPFEAGGEDDRLADYAMFVQLPGWLPEAE